MTEEPAPRTSIAPEDAEGFIRALQAEVTASALARENDSQLMLQLLPFSEIARIVGENMHAGRRTPYDVLEDVMVECLEGNRAAKSGAANRAANAEILTVMRAKLSRVYEQYATLDEGPDRGRDTRPRNFP